MKTILITIMSALCILTFTVPAHASVTYTPMPHGDGSSGYCLNDPDNSTTQGTQVQIWTCYNTVNEDLVAVPECDGSDCGWELVFYNGMCLDASSLNDGAKLQIWDCIQDQHQIWSVGPSVTDSGNDIDGYGWFISHPWYIDLTGNNEADGTKVQVWDSVYTSGNEAGYADASQTWCGPNGTNGEPVENQIC
jgi:hypothetical protein